MTCETPGSEYRRGSARYPAQRRPERATKTEPLGKRLRALFGDIGLKEDIAEWRGQPAKAATL